MGQVIAMRAVLAASLCIALPGCSDDDDSAAPQVSHDEFIAELNRICEEGNREADQLDDELQETADSNDFAKAAELLDQARKANKPYRERFEALDVPSEDEAAFERYATQARLIQRLTGRLADAMRRKDIEEINRAIALQVEARDRRTKAARALGADECGA